MARPPAGAGTNQENVRRHNLGTLLGHLHRAGPLSRSSLTTLMGLNRSTIAGLVAELEELGLVVQGTPVSTAKVAGRPSAAVKPTEHAYVLAVDVRVDGLVVARVGIAGEVLSQATGPSPHEHEPGATADAVADMIKMVIRDADPDSRLVGIGVSVPGIIERGTSVVRLAPNLGWRDVPFGDLLMKRLGVDLVPVLGNDADHGALAEHLRGAARGFDDVVYISGEVGVGAGLIAGGLQVTGASGFAGEVGHLPLGGGVRPCHCGATGCWETEVGAAAIADAVGCPSDRLANLGAFLDELSTAPTDLGAVGAHLGLGLASLVNLLNPRVIVLGGYLRSLYPWVKADIESELAARALDASRAGVTVCPPGLGEYSVLFGASEVAFHALLADPVEILAAAPSTDRLFVAVS